MSTRKLLIAATVARTIEAFLLPYADHFRRLGWQVDAVAAGTAEGRDCKAHFDNIADVSWTRDPLSHANLVALRQVRKLLEEKQYDIVHVHTPVAAFITRAAARCTRRRKTRVVYTAHGFHFHRQGGLLRNSTFETLERVAGAWTDRLVVINREDFYAATRLHIVDADAITYVPGIGLNLEEFRHTACRRNSGSPHRCRTKFLCAAEFIPRKRHEDLLCAFAAMRTRNATLDLCGDGPLLDPMRDLANQLGIADRVNFLGFRRDIRNLLDDCDALVLCSEQEGLPRSVMEAMAMARPVIGTNVRGTRDLLECGGGVLVPVGDIRELTKAMEEIASDAFEAEEMGRQGRAAVQKYDIEHLLQVHERIYAELLER